MAFIFTRVTSSKFGTRTFSAVRAHHTPKSRATHWIIGSSTLVGVSLYILSQKPVHNDVRTAPAPNKRLEHFGLSPFVWGCNQNHLIAPERDSNDCIKKPTPAPELFSSPLRDLAFCAGYAACVDAGGNVYQWGDAFFGADPNESRRPRRTLQGKNIIAIATTPSKIFALSTSGKLYALSSSLKRQETPPRGRSVWDIFGGHESQSSSLTLLDTDVPLRPGERFTSIAAGSHHLLALTSQGRTFAHPITRLANFHGQLGLRKISIVDPADVFKRVPLELTPQKNRDAGISPAMRNPYSYLTEAKLPDTVNDEQTVGLCDRLFEVPALRGVDVQQAVAGDRTSFVVTRRDRRVLGWGANEYGQLGLGANVTLPNVTAPTEVVLDKFTDRGTITRCVSIAAGGDLTYFTVERDLPTGGGSSIVDVLACGNGQWGGLGNASYSNAQGTPVKVKNISGILEYDELTKSLKPLKPHHISVAPGPAADGTRMVPSSSGHVIATLETIPLSHPPLNTSAAADAADAPGRDVLAWGLNQQYQLGFGKRGNVNAPAPVHADNDGGMLMCRVGKEKVKDFDGRVVGKKMEIEQRAVAGPGVSIVYWRIV